MSIWRAPGQTPAKAGRAEEQHGEAMRALGSDEAGDPRHDRQNAEPALLYAAHKRENLQRALNWVRSNKGAAGVDGLDIDQTLEHPPHGVDRDPRATVVGDVPAQSGATGDDPKSDGGARELGIPTVTDRLILQALLQALRPNLDPTLSEHSDRFRSGRSRHPPGPPSESDWRRWRDLADPRLSE
jgi:RNA-directed DNA polymerase